MRTRAGSAPTLSLFLVLSLTPFRALAADPAAAFAEATDAFRRANAGEPGAAARAKTLLDRLAAAHPQDPVVLAYAGSATTLVARDESSPIERMKGVDAGLDQLDLAVRLLGPEHDRPLPGRLPARVETLLIAAATFVALPDGVFHRVQDGKAMVAGVVAGPAFGQLPPAIRARFHMLAAQAARAEKQPAAEQAALQLALAADPAGPLSGPARARLAEVKP
jgi:hypothetical protein